jgi:predicted RNase H-like nuclease (RuvC/YqgF family)
MSGTSLQDALHTAQKARQAAHDHERTHRDFDPGDTVIAARGTELRRLADEATAKYEELQRAARAATATRRRTEQLAEDAELQGRLRAEAQARRDAAALAGSQPNPRGRGLR